MARVINWNLNSVKRLVRKEAAAKTIMKETGIKQNRISSYRKVYGKISNNCE